MARQILIDAPAKINLTLDIKGKRPDGYHELETVMHQISLADQISLTAVSRGIEVYSNNLELPSGEENLAYQAARTILQHGNITAGVTININKRIPIGAGLAGGSTDAAAVLKGINQLYKLGLTREQLADMGAAIGSDVPFCVKGGTALARGRGEIIQPLPPCLKLNLVLVKPRFSVSTADVYRQFKLAGVKKPPDTWSFLEAWHHCDMIGICKAMENVLETVTAANYQEIGQIKAQMLRLGAIKALMSGSGPTVFGVFPDMQSAQSAGQSLQSGDREVFWVTSYDGEES